MTILLAILQTLAVALWFDQVVRVLRYISRHAIAFYATRQERDTSLASPEFVYRIFVQNLENLPLCGDLELKFQLTGARILEVAVYAGPVHFAQRSIAGGSWVLPFSKLPAFDTWLVKIVASAEADLRVRLAPRLFRRASDQKGLGVTSVSTLLLSASDDAILLGTEAVPSWRNLLWTAAIAAFGYGLAIWFAHSSATCYGLALLSFVDKSRCSAPLFPWLNVHVTIDICVGILIVVLTAVAFGVSRRRAPPIAQGYFYPSLRLPAPAPSVTPPASAATLPTSSEAPPAPFCDSAKELF